MSQPELPAYLLATVQEVSDRPAGGLFGGRAGRWEARSLVLGQGTLDVYAPNHAPVASFDLAAHSFHAALSPTGSLALPEGHPLVVYRPGPHHTPFARACGPGRPDRSRAACGLRARLLPCALAASDRNPTIASCPQTQGARAWGHRPGSRRCRSAVRGSGGRSRVRDDRSRYGGGNGIWRRRDQRCRRGGDGALGVVLMWARRAAAAALPRGRGGGGGGRRASLATRRDVPLRGRC